MKVSHELLQIVNGHMACQIYLIKFCNRKVEDMKTGKCPGNHCQSQHLNQDLTLGLCTVSFLMDGLASCTHGSITKDFFVCLFDCCCLILVALSAEDESDTSVSPKIFITVRSSSGNKRKFFGHTDKFPQSKFAVWASKPAGVLMFVCSLYFILSLFLSAQQSLQLHLFRELSHRKHLEGMGRW